MECLTRLVGIWDGCGEKDSSILYINNLPGFDLSIPEHLIKEQDKSPMQLLRDLRGDSAIFLKNEFLANLNPRVEMGSVLFTGIAGFINDNKVLKSQSAGNYGGVQIGTPNHPYTEIFIDRIGWFTKDVVTTTVRIFDLTKGVEIDSFPVTTVADDVTYVTINKSYKNKGQYLNLIAVVDAGLTDTYEVLAFNNGCNDCFRSVQPFSRFTSGRAITIPISSTPIDTNLVGSPHTYGLFVHYSIQCDHEYFLCQMSNRFMLSMYYRFGIRLMDEIIYTGNLNSLTTVRMDKAKTMKKELIDQYNESMNNVMKNLHLPNNACYHCEPKITNNTWIP